MQPPLFPKGIKRSLGRFGKFAQSVVDCANIPHKHYQTLLLLIENWIFILFFEYLRKT